MVISNFPNADHLVALALFFRLTCHHYRGTDKGKEGQVRGVPYPHFGQRLEARSSPALCLHCVDEGKRVNTGLCAGCMYLYIYIYICWGVPRVCPIMHVCAGVSHLA